MSHVNYVNLLSPSQSRKFVFVLYICVCLYMYVYMRIYICIIQPHSVPLHVCVYTCVHVYPCMGMQCMHMYECMCTNPTGSPSLAEL